MPWRKTDTGIVHFVSNRAGLWTEIVEEEMGMKSAQLLELADFGCIYLNDSRIFANSEIKKDDYLRLHTEPRRYPRLSLVDRILYEDQEILIVNKPSGLPSHPTVDNIKENLIYDLSHQTHQKIYPTHRLDVPTSGLIVLTKTAESQLHFQNLLKGKKVQKIYRALVPSPGPAIGFYEHHMEKSRYAPKTLWEHPRANTQVCQLKILSHKIVGETTRLEIELLTGRTHQIRSQLAFLGFPIIGDSLYGHGEYKKNQDRIELCCVSLSFPWKDQIMTCRLESALDGI